MTLLIYLFYTICHAKAVNFSEFSPHISVQIFLCGFPDISLKTTFSDVLHRFLSSKRHGNINVSLSFSVSLGEDIFFRSYIQLMDKLISENKQNAPFRIESESEFTNIFLNAHSQSALRYNSKYSLFLINSIDKNNNNQKSFNNKEFEIFGNIKNNFNNYNTDNADNNNNDDKSANLNNNNVNDNDNTTFLYGDSDVPTNCLLFKFRSGFCQLNSNDDPLPLLFNYTSNFVDEVLLPDAVVTNSGFSSTGRPSPSRIVVPIVTFGPKISVSQVQSEISLLFSPIESLVIVNRQNLYEFPLVATSQLSARIGTLFEALKNTEHVFGSPSITAAFSNDQYKQHSEGKNNSYYFMNDIPYETNAQKVTPIYIFDSNRNMNGVIETDDLLSIIYSSTNNNNINPKTNANSDKNNINNIFNKETENKKNIEKMILSTVVKTVGNLDLLERIGLFGGHHPFLPFGGSTSFSAVLSDSIIRNYVLSNIEYAFNKYVSISQKINEVRALELSFLNTSLNTELSDTLQRMIERTSERISLNELSKALSSSVKAVEVVNEMMRMADELAMEAMVFGQCCPETVYVSKQQDKAIMGAIAITFLAVNAFALYKLYGLWKKKKFTPKALR